MRKLLLTAIAQALIVSFALAQPSADDLQIEIRLSGTVFLNPPQFIITADDQVVGRGEVDAAYDPAVEGDSEVTEDLLAAHSQTFVYALPSGGDPGELTVALTNDRWAGADRPALDRNLYILEIKVGNAIVDLAALPLPEGIGRVGEGIIGIYGNDSVRISRPADGWSCGFSEQIEVTGFQSNSAEVTADMRAVLVELVGRLQNQHCPIMISGFASADGPPEWNVTLAKLRAEAVAEVLGEGGHISPDRIQIVAEGSTAEFGGSSDNRRVTIQIGTPGA